MKKQVRLQTFLFIFLMAGLNSVFGQGVYDEPEARLSAEKLAKSVLIVRLPVNGPKIRYLTQKIKNATNEKVSQDLQSELDAAKELNLKKFNAIRNALSEHYTVSPFLIMPDSSYLAFTKDEKVGFIGENGNIDPGLVLNFEEYYFLVSG